MLSTQLWWFLGRASGIVAWWMLTASVVIGIVFASDLFPRQRRPKWLLDLHRGLAALTLAFVGLHLLALYGDSYLELGPMDLFVPFVASWRRWAVALGVLAFWGLVAVQTTSAMMHRMPRRWWRAVHLGSYGVFVMVALHGTLAGSDASRGWYVVGTTIALAAVMAGTIYRVLQRRSRQPALEGRGKGAGRPQVGSAPR